MENNQQNNTNDELLEMGAHNPQVDLARNKNLYKKSLYFAGAFVVILLIVLTFQYLGHRSAVKEVAKADTALLTAQDSAQVQAAMDLYKKAADGSYAPNMRAKIVSAEYQYGEGNYEEALKFLEGVKVKSPRVAAGVFLLRGDCYVNLDKLDEGIAQFEDALAEAGNNPELAPYALTKLANVYRVKGDYAKEAEMLQRIMTEYPEYNTNIESDLARAQAAAK